MSLLLCDMYVSQFLHFKATLYDHPGFEEASVLMANQVSRLFNFLTPKRLK